MKGQFGVSYRHLHHFKPRFTQAIELATAVYPDAKLDVREEGVVLKPSKPPVPPRLAIR